MHCIVHYVDFFVDVIGHRIFFQLWLASLTIICLTRYLSEHCNLFTAGPSCSKLTTSLVNDSLKFTSSDMQICWNFCWKHMSSFCSAKATHIFSAKNFRILYIESAKTVNEMTLNELVKLMMLWTTGPWFLRGLDTLGSSLPFPPRATSFLGFVFALLHA